MKSFSHLVNCVVDSRGKDSALRDKSWISARVLRLHTL